MSNQPRRTSDIEDVQPKDIFEKIVEQRETNPAGPLTIEVTSTDVNGDPVVITLIVDENNYIINTGDTE